jgi:hypothetical protein
VDLQISIVMVKRPAVLRYSSGAHSTGQRPEAQGKENKEERGFNPALRPFVFGPFQKKAETKNPSTNQRKRIT